MESIHESQISHEKFRTLQQNMAVIAEQKNRMEQMFQLDKKKLKVKHFNSIQNNINSFYLD